MSSSSSNGLAGGDEKNSSQLRQSCGERVVEKVKDKSTMISPTTLIDNEKKADDEVLLRRHQRAYLYRSISEATGTGESFTETSSDEDEVDDELDETSDVLYPLVDEQVNSEVEKATNSSLSLHSGKRKKNVREFQQMRSRTEVNLYEKLLRQKFHQKVNPLIEK